MELNREERWRMILGKEADGLPGPQGDNQARDQALDSLYNSPRKSGLGGKNPSIARWLGDIRRFFPSSVVQIIQRDAIERVGLTRMLLEPESLRAVQPDIHLAASILELKDVLPEQTRETAREVVQTVADELMERLETPMRVAVNQSLNRSVRNYRPKLREMDWDRTIRANLKHYQPDLKSIIPERKIGFGRHGTAVKHIILAMDQSGSMAESVVYTGIYAAVLASIRSLKVNVVAFDGEFTDLSDHLEDPVELLFATRLGGGTDIEPALAYCTDLVETPSDTIMVLISDLFDSSPPEVLLRRVRGLIQRGVKFITILALSDEGEPIFNEDLARELANLGSPAFACTPDQFPSVMADALRNR